MRRLNWFGFWTLLGLVSSAQLHFANPGGAPHSPSWWQALATTLPDWYLWGLLALLVAWLGRHFQVDRANFSRHFIIHLGASLNLALVHVVAAVAVQDRLHALRGEPSAFVQELLAKFLVSFHWDILIYWAILAVVHALDYHRDLEARRAHAAELEARLAALADGALPVADEDAARRPTDRLLVADDGRRFFVRTVDVEWIEAARNYVQVHASGRVHTVRTTLGALEARLDAGQFRRISRSALVNIDRVREVQPWFHGDAVVILEGGARLSLSRRYRANLLGTLTP